MQKNRRIEIMDLTEKLNLMGYSKDESKQLQSVDEVADFICKNGKRGDVTITNNGEPFITTIGIYLDKVADIRYRAQLMPVLAKKQKTLFSGINKVSETNEDDFTR
jgi:hypothetical protein